MSNDDSVAFATTIHVRDTCLCLHAQRAARALARHFDEVFRPLNLTNGQFSLMMSLNRPKPPTLSAVADLLAMDRTTLTAALKALERRGLVAVAADRQDKRVRRLSLTPDGSRLLAEALPLWVKMHRALDEDIAPLSSDTLREGLMALSNWDPSKRDG
ncbi:MarR family winged helix-turn-helix transcriptional regulator [Consotaella salsifontis]|uniref:DNA-binding transcriptional regulator, MarR family n=1 Tax=Consotaella salsifontis TaxID=1365950 RepID=A0A1T4N2H8_9HYPH|nr:MarR family transcriptional regulator [Consotaella salsifontis]SJZ73237.1 DNA-binding transcriptional regulator, MarR family [Consotaella salsifontis]